ncbi:MAG: sorbosone dehydrogenase family protein [Woeseiaceae bacterium]|nr:sorbosone dehydrogenase family protein [Woeseiaceae bacterium]
MRVINACLWAVLFVVADLAGAAEFDLEEIKLPKGFQIEEYADVPNARSLALGENGTIFVSNRRKDSVYAVVPRPGGAPDVIELLSDLNMPNGIAFHLGSLYVAELDRITRYDNIENRLTNMPDPVLVTADLPGERHHGWRYIGFGPDNRLYISIGAPCNICERDSEGFAQIWRMNPDGSDRQTYVQGVRNSVGFTWHPETREMWFTDNGRDMLGDNLPPDELNRVRNAGMNFGYPYCHGNDIVDPEFGGQAQCSDFVPPAQELGPHVAALGLAFYTGTMFPDDYRGEIFIAEHGSWNRSKKIGYRISLVRLEDGWPVSYETFAEGWLKKQNVRGRPVDVLMHPDGSLIVSDDHRGKLYRISYKEE